MKKILYLLITTSLFLSCAKKTESNDKKKMILLGGILLLQKPTPAYLCDRTVTCRKYPTNYKTQVANYNCLFDSTNFQYKCILTPLSGSGQGTLIYYYSNRSNFIDESACIGLIKKTRYTYVGTVNLDGNLNGIDFNYTFTSQGFPLKYLDPGQGTTVAASWDKIGRPLSTEKYLLANGNPYYLQYRYDDSNLKILADYVQLSGSDFLIYGPNERIFDQDYNEIQRNTFRQDSTGTVTFTEAITINATDEVCK